MQFGFLENLFCFLKNNCRHIGMDKNVKFSKSKIVSIHNSYINIQFT